MIPKILHQVWLGNASIPKQLTDWQSDWKAMYPKWEYCLWTDRSINKLLDGYLLDLCRSLYNKGEASDIVRYAAMAKIGGVYVDFDMEPVRPFAPHILSLSAFVGLEAQRKFKVGNAILGAVPKHPFFIQLLKEIPNFRKASRVFGRTGPEFLTTLFHQHVDPPTVFPCSMFYRQRNSQRDSNIYTLHHGTGMWRGQENVAVKEPLPPTPGLSRSGQGIPSIKRVKVPNSFTVSSKKKKKSLRPLHAPLPILSAPNKQNGTSVQLRRPRVTDYFSISKKLTKG
jgi:mannosyltransferase OCH1-like enzyme